MIRKILALLTVSTLLTAAAPLPPQPTPKQSVNANWGTKIAISPQGGHIIGNPAAKVKLIEYLSYTCPHCATFQSESEAAIQLAFIPSGKGSVEIRHYVRDPVDLAAGVLVNCAPPAKFYKLHQAILHNQNIWAANIGKSNATIQKRWFTGPIPARMRAIAADMHWYEMMENLGYGRVAVDKCLANEALANRLSNQTDADTAAGITGTPSFAINGQILAGTHNWHLLQPQLDARM
ncbi:MAG: hypothetical protein RLY97_2069 [Pseudomonadota bacterium]